MAYAFLTGRGDSGALDGPYSSGAFNSLTATLIVIALSYDAANVPVLSDSQTNSWTPLTVRSNGAGAATRLYYSANPSTSATHTATVSGSGITSGIAIACFSGLPGTTDQENGASGNANSLATGSVTPTQADELIITSLVKDHNETPAIGGGFTIAGTGAYVPGSNFMSSIAYLIQTTAAAANPSWSCATPANFGLSIQTWRLGVSAPSWMGRTDIGAQLPTRFIPMS